MHVPARNATRALAASLAFVALLNAKVARAEKADPPSNPSADRVAPLAHQAWQQANSASALVPLHRLYNLKADLDELEPLEDAFSSVANSRRSLPEIAALARFYQADILRARGLPNRAADATQRLGLFTHFMLIGGFDNEGKAGFDKAYPPETELDFTKRYPGKERDIGWRRLDVLTPDGYADLSSAVRPVHDSAIYAVTDLDVTRDVRAVLHVGASGATRIWVDGQKVLEDKQYHPASFDQHAVAINLKKGTHRVMLKLAQSDGAMGFWLRLSGTRGEALSAVTQKIPTGPITPPRGGLQPEQQPALVDALDKKVRQSPNDPKAHEELAEALAFTHTYDSKDRRPAQEAERAAALAPKDADAQMLAAKLEDEDANVRRGYLEAAAAAAPDQAEPQLELARDDLNRGHPERALKRLQSLATRNDSVPLQLLWARTQDELGDFAGAQQRVQATVRAHPRAVAALRESARQARRLDRHRDVVGSLRVVLALRYDDLEARRQLVQELVSLGELDAAMAEQDKLLALDPSDLYMLAQRGQLLAANGKGADARAVFKRAEAQCPDDAQLREDEGKALLSLGDKGSAVQAFNASLALRPQNPRLKDALRTLQNQEHGFGEDLALDAQGAHRAAPGHEGRGRGDPLAAHRREGEPQRHLDALRPADLAREHRPRRGRPALHVRELLARPPGGQRAPRADLAVRRLGGRLPQRGRSEPAASPGAASTTTPGCAW